MSHYAETYTPDGRAKTSLHSADADRGLFGVADDNGHPLGASRVMWQLESRAVTLSAAAASVKDVQSEAVDLILEGLGAALESGDGAAAGALLLASGFAFVRLHEGARLYVLRDGEAREVAAPDLAMQVVAGDRFLLTSAPLSDASGLGALDTASVPSEVRQRAAGTGAGLSILVVEPAVNAASKRARARARALRELFLFQGLPFEARLKLQGLGHTERFQRGSIILREGQTGDSMYVLLDGAIEVSLRGKTLSQLGPGAPFGEMALLDDEPRSATVRAMDYCEVLVISRRELFAFCAEEPNIGIALISRLARHAGRMVRHMNESLTP